MPLGNKLLAFGSLGGMSAIIFDALCSHRGTCMVNSQNLALVQTAVDYQLYNSLCLLVIGLLCKGSSSQNNLIVWAGFSLAAGVIIFCGSLYAKGFFQIEIVGFLTPLGGGLLIFGWGCLFLASLSAAVSGD